MEERAKSSSGYWLPPTDVVRWVDAPREPSVLASPDYQWLLILHRSSHPSIADLAKPCAKLAGFRFEPQNRCAFQTEYWTGIELRRFEESDTTTIPLPVDSKIGRVSWSHCNDAVAFTLCFEDRTELWWLDISKPQEPKRLSSVIVEALCEFDWTSDGKRIVYFQPHRPESDRPQKSAVPTGPVIEQSIAVESPSRTYQDLLNNEEDAELFEFLTSVQPTMVNPKSLETQTVGPPGIYLSCDSSPDDNYFLVSQLKRPFSYTLPFQFFPRLSFVCDRYGAVLYPICDLPLADRIPIEGVRTGPRQIGWLAGDDATLVWCEALDGGDPRTKVEHRDRLVMQPAPFQTKPRELLRVEQRYTGRLSLQPSNLLLVTQYDRDRRWTRTLLHDLNNADAGPKVLSDRNVNDHYGDPGNVMMVRDQHGSRIALQVGNSIALSGHGANPEGALPFLDLWNVDTGKSHRVWRCEAGCYESVIHLREARSAESIEFVTRHESKVSPPNCRWHRPATSSIQWVTHFVDPLPELREFPKRLVKYQRWDGIELSANLYLPKNYQSGERLPLLIWAYPLEYSDPNTAGQNTKSPERFTRLMGCSHLTLLTQGFAIMDNATMPIVGDPETMNDTFIEQVVESAQATIDFAVNEGFADRDRVGVGGHSYGAFMVANLMAHSTFFRAGIARSGAYNRSLTPFGFQAERRPLWQAKDVYQKLSPFLFADQIKQPLLLIHGEDDNNPGTLTMQSKRMYQAIKGNGGICRLVLLPNEGHGYKARESVLHTQAEMVSWMNRYVRDR